MSNKPSYQSVLESIHNFELENPINNVEVSGIPLWRLVRSNVLDGYLYNKYGFLKRNTTTRRIKKQLLIKNILSSFFCLFGLLLKRKMEIQNVFFAFPRLQKIDGYYLDKFTDPVIDKTQNLGDVLIIQKSMSGVHFQPRYRNEKVMKSDFIDFFSIVLGILLSPFIYLVYNKKVKLLYQYAFNIFGEIKRFKFLLSFKLGATLVGRFLYLIVFKRLGVKYIFLVNRDLHHMPISAAKKHNIIVNEFQHGTTLKWSILYSCVYNSKIDPDFFLSFGSYWKDCKYAIPPSKIINIGWAYNPIKKNGSTPKSNKSVIVISEPRLSNNIINNVIMLAYNNQDYTFCLRPHPQENISNTFKEKIDNIANIEMANNKIDSTIAIQDYEYVIGVNSTVLFESIFLGKRVGSMNFGGCIANFEQGTQESVLFILNKIDDFKIFVKDQQRLKHNNKEFYSKFNTDWFDELKKLKQIDK